MKISVFGLGYVGCVSIGCLANSGHEIIGVDVIKSKVDLINDGRPTIVEESITELIRNGYEKKCISATINPRDAVIASDVSIIAVGTPSSVSGKLNLDYLFGTAIQIGKILKEKSTYHLIIIRSTVFPGTNQKYGEFVEQYSEKKRFKDFDIVSNPEFLREGSAVSDYYNPPITVIGSQNEKAVEIMKSIYSDINAPFYICDIRIAEFIKYVNNAFHALKVVFANEVGSICKTLNLDARDVMTLFCLDKKLNLSSYYLQPGFAYGGSCLPKDLKALSTISHDSYIETPVLNSIEMSNNQHKKRALDQIYSKNIKRIGVIGLSFKEGTDDLRYSPIVDLIETLLGKGYEIKIFDQNVSLSHLQGTNKSFIDQHIPHLVNLLVEKPKTLFENSELIILNQKNSVANTLVQEYPNLYYYDLVGIPKLLLSNYDGICW